MSVNSFEMRKPADMHQHLRSGALLQLTLPLVVRRFAMAIVMPNLTPPITTAAAMINYEQKIRYLEDEDGIIARKFRPLMTLYLTDHTTSEEIDLAMNAGCVGVKYYPPGLTTNSEHGVANPASLWTKGLSVYDSLRRLAKRGGVLLIHAADGVDKDREELDPYDQEKHFIHETLPRIRDAHPELKISVEHLSTMEGAEYMRKNGGKLLGCSLTAHHLLLDRRDMFRGGFRPDRFWWPIIQRKEHRDALRELGAEGHDFVWLGGDSAPHTSDKKYAACCSGGVLMAHAGIELYAEAFDQMGALDQRFENFASINGLRFFGLEPSDEQITLIRKSWKVPPMFLAAAANEEPVVPFRLGEEVHWQIAA